MQADRESFLKMILKNMGRGKVCVEVGVMKGEHAKMMLDILHPSKLILVDLWRSRPEAEQETRTLFAGNPIIELIKDNSENVNIGPVDFVYIDTFHNKPAVERDLNHWWPQVRKGGWMTGHDYGMVPESPMFIEVEDAVDDFAVRHERFVQTWKNDWLKEWAIKK